MSKDTSAFNKILSKTKKLIRSGDYEDAYQWLSLCINEGLLGLNTLFVFNNPIIENGKKQGAIYKETNILEWLLGIKDGFKVALPLIRQHNIDVCKALPSENDPLFIFAVSCLTEKLCFDFISNLRMEEINFDELKNINRSPLAIASAGTNPSLKIINKLIDMGFTVEQNHEWKPDEFHRSGFQSGQVWMHRPCFLAGGQKKLYLSDGINKLFFDNFKKLDNNNINYHCVSRASSIKDNNFKNIISIQILNMFIGDSLIIRRKWLFEFLAYLNDEMSDEILKDIFIKNINNTHNRLCGLMLLTKNGAKICSDRIQKNDNLSCLIKSEIFKFWLTAGKNALNERITRLDLEVQLYPIYFKILIESGGFKNKYLRDNKKLIDISVAALSDRIGLPLIKKMYKNTFFDYKQALETISNNKNEYLLISEKLNDECEALTKFYTQQKTYQKQDPINIENLMHLCDHVPLLKSLYNANLLETTTVLKSIKSARGNTPELLQLSNDIEANLLKQSISTIRNLPKKSL